MQQNWHASVGSEQAEGQADEHKDVDIYQAGSNFHKLSATDGSTEPPNLLLYVCPFPNPLDWL